MLIDKNLLFNPIAFLFFVELLFFQAINFTYKLFLLYKLKKINFCSLFLFYFSLLPLTRTFTLFNFILMLSTPRSTENWTRFFYIFQFFLCYLCVHTEKKHRVSAQKRFVLHSYACAQTFIAENDELNEEKKVCIQ